jgi:phosphatidylglycerol:prolipoprotein diacylglycerol transferase
MLRFPDIDPVAISIGPVAIRWYALAYLAGFFLGWAYSLYLDRMAAQEGGPAQRPGKQDIDDFLPWAVMGVILGGRLGYVLFYQPGYYLSSPLSILQVWQGGMAFHGGALGVIAALILYSWRHKINVLRLSDIVCAAVPIGLFFGRIANFINGELFGRESSLPWAMVFPRGGDVARHPSQIYEAGLEGLVLFLVLFALYRMRSIRNRPGIVSGVFLAGYAAARFVVEYAREPDGHIGLIGGWISMGQILCLPMAALGAGVIAFALRQKTAA